MKDNVLDLAYKTQQALLRSISARMPSDPARPSDKIKKDDSQGPDDEQRTRSDEMLVDMLRKLVPVLSSMDRRERQNDRDQPSPFVATQDAVQRPSGPVDKQGMAGLIDALKAAMKDAPRHAPHESQSVKEWFFGTKKEEGVSEEEKTKTVDARRQEVERAEKETARLQQQEHKRESDVFRAHEKLQKIPETKVKLRERAQERVDRSHDALEATRDKLGKSQEGVKAAREGLAGAMEMPVGKEGKVGKFGDMLGSMQKQGAGGIDGLKGMLAGLGQMHKATGKDDIAGLGGGAVKAAGGGIGMAVGALGGGPVGAAVVGGLTAVGTAAFSAVGKLQEWSNTLHESNLRFAEFSGAMAQMAANQQVREMMLGKARGDRRAGAATELANAKQNLAETMAPVQDAFDNGISKLYTLGLQGINKIAEPLVKILEYVGLIDDKDKPTNDDLRMPEWIEDTRKDFSDTEGFW